MTGEETHLLIERRKNLLASDLEKEREKKKKKTVRGQNFYRKILIKRFEKRKYPRAVWQNEPRESNTNIGRLAGFSFKILLSKQFWEATQLDVHALGG